MSETYKALTERFETTYKLPKGGKEFDYASTEQVITRLNEVLGYDAWSFHVVDHGQVDRDVWVLGRLVVHGPNGPMTKEQFGEQTAENKMPAGDVLKSATSSALKKCASLIGIGLYLSDKDEHAPPPDKRVACRECGALVDRALANMGICVDCRSAAAKQRLTAESAAVKKAAAPVLACEQCGEHLRPVRRKDGSTWTVDQLAVASRLDFRHLLCGAHYGAAFLAKQQAEGLSVKPLPSSNGSQDAQPPTPQPSGGPLADRVQLGQIANHLQRTGRAKWQICKDKGVKHLEALPHATAAAVLAELTALPTVDARQKLGLEPEETPAAAPLSDEAPISQIATLRAHLRRTGQDEATVCEDLDVKRLEDLSRERASTLIQSLVKRPSATLQPANAQ